MIGTGAALVASSAGLLGPGGSEDPIVRLSAAVGRAVRLEQRSQYGALVAVLPGILGDAHHALYAGARASAVAAGHLATIQMVEAFVFIKHDRQQEALVAATDGLRAAQLSGDHVLVGAVLRCLAEAHLRAGDFELACDLASESAAHVGRAGLTTAEAIAVQGAGLLSAATSCARAGDRVEATRLLVNALNAADQLATDIVGRVVFGPTNVAIHRVAFEVELGDPRAALRFASQFHPERGRGMEERRARYLIDVARAHVAMRQDRQAVEALIAGELISSEEIHTHRHTKALIAEMLRRERRGAVADLRPLATRCKAIEML
jgi:hypothetical protein